MKNWFFRTNFFSGNKHYISQKRLVTKNLSFDRWILNMVRQFLTTNLNLCVRWRRIWPPFSGSKATASESRQLSSPRNIFHIPEKKFKIYDGNLQDISESKCAYPRLPLESHMNIHQFSHFFHFLLCCMYVKWRGG